MAAMYPICFNYIEDAITGIYGIRVELAAENSLETTTGEEIEALEPDGFRCPKTGKNRGQDVSSDTVV